MPDGLTLMQEMQGIADPPKAADSAQLEFDAFMAERNRLIDALFAQREQPKTVQPYPDPFLPLLTGVVSGVSSAVGGTIAGLGVPLRWMDTAVLENKTETFLSDLAAVVEKGGSWIQEHPLMPQASLERLKATVAFPIISDDGRPIWDAGSWVTDAQGQFDAHRRLWEATRSMSGQIGEGAGLILTLLGPGKFLKIAKATEVAVGVGAMSSINARTDYQRLTQAGVDPDIAAREAALYGAVTGPIGYAEAIIGSKAFKGAVGALGEGAGKGKAFEWTVERILGNETGQIPTVPSMVVNGVLNNVQGWLTNPSQQRAFDAMRARDANWQPTGPEQWYTQEQAYSDFALGAGLVGFLRATGRLFHTRSHSAETMQKEAAGVDTSNEPMDAARKATVEAGAATGNAWEPRSVVEQRLQGLYKDFQSGEQAKNKDATNEDLIRAAFKYAEEPDAGLKYYSDRMNVAVLDDRVRLPTDEERSNAVGKRVIDVAKDDSRAQQFLNDSSATVRPVQGQPLWAPDRKNADAITRPIRKADVPDDVPLKMALGFPVRTDHMILPAERQAIDALRTELNEVWKSNPDAKVNQLVAPVVAVDQAEALRMGLNPDVARQDSDKRVFVRLGPSVAFVGGKPVIQLPRDFTLRDLQQAHVELLGAENASGKGPVVARWNENAQHLRNAATAWWKQVAPAVQHAAAFDPAIALESTPAEQRLGVLSQKLTQLLSQAQRENRTATVANLTRLQQRLTTPDLPSREVSNAAKTLDRIARSMPGTQEMAKARQLLEIVRNGDEKDAMKGLAYVMARPEAMPDAARMASFDAEMIDGLLAEQRGAPMSMTALGKLDGATETAASRPETAAEVETKAVQAESAEKAQIAKDVEDLRKPLEETEPGQVRIVATAVSKDGGKTIIAKSTDFAPHDELLGGKPVPESQRGFIDSEGKWHNREEAAKIAREAGQADVTELHSSDLHPPELTDVLDKGFTQKAVAYGKAHPDERTVADLQRRLDEGTKVLDTELPKEDPDLNKAASMASVLQWYREAIESARAARGLPREVTDADLREAGKADFPDYATFRSKFESERDAAANESEKEYLQRKVCE